MSHYIHHVPGRLRVRSKAFRCNPTKARSLEQVLRTLDGIYEVKYNDRNGSLTITYDAASDGGDQALAMLSDAGCLATAAARPTEGVTATFGKAVIAAVAQQTVIRSFNSLVTVLR